LGLVGFGLPGLPIFEGHSVVGQALSPAKPACGLNRYMDDPIRLPITDVFDLHSVPARDAREVVEEYLIEAHRLGLKALRIIHGRGIGVQREMVRAILARTPFVEAFRDAPAEAGGWGATIVTLR
jgi:hypothetical protein